MGESWGPQLNENHTAIADSSTNPISSTTCESSPRPEASAPPAFSGENESPRSARALARSITIGLKNKPWPLISNSPNPLAPWSESMGWELLGEDRGFLEWQLKRSAHRGFELDPGNGSCEHLFHHEALERDHAPLGQEQVVDKSLSTST